MGHVRVRGITDRPSLLYAPQVSPIAVRLEPQLEYIISCCILAFAANGKGCGCGIHTVDVKPG